MLIMIIKTKIRWKSQTDAKRIKSMYGTEKNVNNNVERISDQS